MTSQRRADALTPTLGEASKELTDELDGLRHHLNSRYPDTVGLIGRLLLGETEEPGRQLSGLIRHVDVSGTEVAIAASGSAQPHERVLKHRFGQPCATLDDVRAELFALLVAAREQAGTSVPLTSLERELAGVAFTTFVSRVAAVTDLTPTLRQITFNGGLNDFSSLGGDQFLYVLLPPPGQVQLSVGADFSWQQYEEMPEDARPVGAYYSIRAWRPDEREIDMWFVTHGDNGDASAWAARAEVGQPVALWGPRRSFDPPATTKSYLLIVDETGFGAAAAILDELIADDSTAQVCLIAESDGEAGRVAFPSGANTSVEWLDRSGAPPGSTSLLVDAVAELSVAPDIYAFGAGESRRITEVRKHLRNECGLSTEQVSMTGYWRAS